MLNDDLPRKPDRILRWRATCEMIGLSRPTLWRLVRSGDFPAPIELSSHRAVGWSEREVASWIAERANRRRVLTGGGGEHVLFACPDNVTVNSSNAKDNPVLGAGTDIRAQGGYIVAVPSRHISGRSYAWSVDHHPADIPLAQAPAWLIERLAVTAQAASNGHDPQEWAASKAGMICEYRDMAVTQVAGKLLRAVSLDPRFVATLVHDWNQCHCQPPLPEDEVAAIIKRIAKREIQRLRAEAQHA
jgi:predicted DNA-binding transcriptional regulator AlpA